MNDHDKLISAVESLLNDISEMRVSDNWYGSFSEYLEVPTEFFGGFSANIEWPNLSISTEAVEQALEAFTKSV